MHEHRPFHYAPRSSRPRKSAYPARHLRNKRYARACSVQVEPEHALNSSAVAFLRRPGVHPASSAGQAFAEKCSIPERSPWPMADQGVCGVSPVKADATSPAHLLINRPKLFSARAQAKISYHRALLYKPLGCSNSLFSNS